MTGDRARGLRPSRAESEDLLDGGGSGPLRELLVAASAPAHREETAGETAAASAFVAARRDGTPAGTAGDEVPAPGPGSRGVALRTAGWWRAPSRFAAALALALATTGVAVGAATVVLRDAPPAVAPPAASAPAPVPEGDGRVAAGLPEDVRVATCGAWGAAGASTTPDRTTDPAFGPLIDAAGGAPNVDGYCAAPPAAPIAPTAPGSAAESGAATSSTLPTATAPRDGAGAGAGAAPGTDAPGAARESAEVGRGEPAEGRSVGPPATPPGRATDRNGRAEGRSVGPPADPPGRGRGSAGDDG
ncbi:hypothetical protein ACQPX6_22865 [Actinomycetospora sp. CA-101289]|uniref:hypothetical protein n=1 Tax=Actinomycetospora sp. CA-101289 TaxID=3239893 RepID=UPI003D97742C